MRENSLRAALTLAAVVALSGCVSHAPRLQIPDRVHADCENRAVKQTAIDSIVASTDDRIRSTPYPGDAALLNRIGKVGGAFAYWKAQPLALPRTAQSLGEKGPYLDLVRAVITTDVDEADHSRPIWLTFHLPGGDRTVLERAYDVQNVCIEGQIEP